MTSYRTPTFLRRPSISGNCMMTPIEPVRVPGFATIRDAAVAR
jgi:hypothetical protein